MRVLSTRTKKRIQEHRKWIGRKGLMTRAFFAGSRRKSSPQAPHQRRTSTTRAARVVRGYHKRTHSNRLSSMDIFARRHGSVARRVSEGSALANTKLCRYDQYCHTQNKQTTLHWCCCWSLLHRVHIYSNLILCISIFHFSKSMLFKVVFGLCDACADTHIYTHEVCLGRTVSVGISTWQLYSIILTWLIFLFIFFFSVFSVLLGYWVLWRGELGGRS